jgi:hypothetical protein
MNRVLRRSLLLGPDATTSVCWHLTIDACGLNVSGRLFRLFLVIVLGAPRLFAFGMRRTMLLPLRAFGCQAATNETMAHVAMFQRFGVLNL